MSRRRRWLYAAGCGIAVGLLLGGIAGIAVGLVTVVAAERALRRVESPRTREERVRARGDLPFATDLLAAALRTGAPPDRAAIVVGEAVGGPVGARLTLVGRALRLGASPRDAWAHLADLPGGRRLSRVAARSADRGTALTVVLERQAADLRVEKAAAGEASARRVGVLVVLPLGVCFLPAFVLIGVVPVVAAIIRDVLRAL
ncbi:type II secretion system F family protein [Dactylosporangium sp. NBC_01737]|uniref:type II secretion system F family protein n=1 Tax=Dactylosporangium sp. NBC_01737 TaxID=2975959 RepID=UPI002E103FE8|nr:type II secretion system F family protein [Dactylosporangium sp. NBC_01737]